MKSKKKTNSKKSALKKAPKSRAKSKSKKAPVKKKATAKASKKRSASSKSVGAVKTKAKKSSKTKARASAPKRAKKETGHVVQLFVAPKNEYFTQHEDSHDHHEADAEQEKLHTKGKDMVPATAHPIKQPGKHSETN